MHTSRSHVQGNVHLATILFLLGGFFLATMTLAAGWTANFPYNSSVARAGLYTGDTVAVTLESFSPLEVEPSQTATFLVTDLPLPYRPEILPGQSRLVFRDNKPGLMPGDEPGEGFSFKRGTGSIVALGWVDEAFTDVHVSVDVNIEGGPGGSGSFSRQGVLARWDKANNWYWCYVNFASGEVGIWRTSYYGQQKVMGDSTKEISGFDNTKIYRLDFEVKASTLACRVFENQEGTLRLVADTGPIVDPEPLAKGASGVMAGLAAEEPFIPLEGSFANLQAQPIGGSGAPVPPSPTATQLRDEVESGQVLGPGTFTDHVRVAKAFAKEGNAKMAVEYYKKALLRLPNDAETLNDLAWIEATHPDPAVRNPAEAVEHANRAFDALMIETNTRHTSKINKVYSKETMLKIGYTQAAAFAAAGKLSPGSCAPALKAANALPNESSCDCLVDFALATTDWAVEVARNEHQKLNTPESAALLERFVQAETKFKQGRTLIGESQP